MLESAARKRNSLGKRLSTVISLNIIPETLQNSEDILNALGDLRRFQMLQIFVLSFQLIPCITSDLAVVFYTLEPIGIQFANLSNLTSFSQFRSTHDCAELDSGNGSTDNYTMVYKDRQWSIIGDMNLICGKYWLAAFTTTSYFLGTVASGPLFGWAADKFGRRPVLLIGNLIFTLLQTALIFSRDLVSFGILRFLIGATRQGIIVVSIVLLMEWTTTKRRSMVQAIAQYPFTFGALNLALMAYLFQNWHHLQIAITFCNFAAVGLYWFAPESIRWLLSHGRTDEVKKICDYIVRFNGIEFEKDNLEEIQRISIKLVLQNNQLQSKTVLECFRTPYIRLFAFLTSLLNVILLIVYLGLCLMTNTLYGNIYVNFAIGAAMELITRTLCLSMVHRVKNRPGLAFCMAASAVFCLLAAVIPNHTSLGRHCIIAMAFLARMSIVGTYPFVSLFSNELFPTVIRNNGVMLAMGAGRVGAAIAPQIVFLSQVNEGTFSGLAYVIFAVLSATGAVATIFLPETKGLALPETTEDSERLGEKHIGGLLQRVKERFGRELKTSESQVEIEPVTEDPIVAPRVRAASLIAESQRNRRFSVM